MINPITYARLARSKVELPSKPKLNVKAKNAGTMQFSRPSDSGEHHAGVAKKPRISWNLVREIRKQVGSPQQPPQSESNGYGQTP